MGSGWSSRRTPESLVVGALVCQDGAWGGEPPDDDDDHEETYWTVVEECVARSGRRCGQPLDDHEERLEQFPIPEHLLAVHRGIRRFLVRPSVLSRSASTGQVTPHLHLIGWGGENLWTGGTSLFLFRHFDAWQRRVRLFLYTTRLPQMSLFLPFDVAHVSFPHSMLCGMYDLQNRSLFRDTRTLLCVDAARVGYHCHRVPSPVSVGLQSTPRRQPVLGALLPPPPPPIAILEPPSNRSVSSALTLAEPHRRRSASLP